MKNLNLMIDDLIIRALKEDMPFGDVSTDSLFDGTEEGQAHFIAKQQGVVCGLFVAKRVFELVDETTVFTPLVEEGQLVEDQKVIAMVKGKTASLLKAERTALNFLQRMSGISTLTHLMQQQVKGLGIKITDTRKTVPGLRVLDKWAVKAGGGWNHRFSLSDAVMLKDNHIKAAGGIKKAVEKVKGQVGHTVKIEVETETLEQVQQAVEAGVDIIMLDNMETEQIKKAIQLIDKKALIEISGNIDAESIQQKAVEGVDIMSSGQLTHSAKSMDISLKFQ